ncbi:MAG: hypothetical protein AAGM21_00240 [Pseudomonadota bacterium]
MSEPKQNLAVLAGILALWVLVFGWSVIGSWGMEPTGDGFTRGMNRVTHFLGWQAIAACLALAAFGVGRAWPKGSGARSVSRLPLGCVGVLVLLLAAYIGWAMIQGG